MGQRGHVYGTGRPRIRDRTEGVGFINGSGPHPPQGTCLWEGIDEVRFVNGFHTPGGVGEVFRAAGWEV